MMPRLSQLITALGCLLLVFSVINAQPPEPVECPTIAVKALKPTLSPDEVAQFTVRITPKKPEWNFRFNWTLTQGQILDGQGTDTITVRRPSGSVVDATVNIAGGPDDTMCPVASTERATWETLYGEKATCPSIQIKGPASVPIPGQLSTYTAGVSLNGSRYEPRFNWSISAGEIVSGQGTDSVVIRPPYSSLTVTVDLIGLPDGCKVSASESNSGPEPPPQAVKIAQSRGAETPGPDHIKRFTEELKNNPNNHGYIFIGHPAGTTHPQMNAREQSIRDSLRKADPDGFDGSRITIKAVQESADGVEFWRIPPGANNPSCESCERKKPLVCPTIEVNGPFWIVEDGHPFKFTATVKGEYPNKVEYKWKVSKGQIIDGQGTAEITVIDTEREGSLTGSVEVVGLPKECPATASEVTPPRETVQPVRIDEVELSIAKVSDQTLRDAAQEQKNNPNNNLYIIAYTDKTISQFDVRQAVKKVSEFLIKEMKLTDNDFEIETIRSETNAVKIYRRPPGSDKPTP